MIKFENIDVYGFEAAIRGMRNPKNSWNLSDSFFENGRIEVIGDKDLKLMKTLSKAGNDHGKFLRMINVTMDITAPLYWWKEFDTYKIGTVANSCSTMHKIQDKEFTLDDFSVEHLSNDEALTLTIYPTLGGTIVPISSSALEVFNQVIISLLNDYRNEFNKTGNKSYWWQMIQLLPTSYNQKRTVQMNYAVLKNIYFARKDHKLDEWHDFCSMIETLPYAKELICLED